jgi:hypothetical protein
MTSTIIEHPDSDSNSTKFRTTTDKEVRLARIKKLRSRINTNILGPNDVNNQNLRSGDIFNRMSKVGEGDSHKVQLERSSRMSLNHVFDERSQLGRVFLHKSGNINNTGGRGIDRKLNRIIRGLDLVPCEFVETPTERMEAGFTLADPWTALQTKSLPDFEWWHCFR